ncbi:MAG TPA: sulfate permease [Candidatus Omnitrophota bacterium]|nr:sulfate permease [Candidatus Omnitrophota bacterium]
MERTFEPKLISVLKEGYTPQLLVKDLIAGIIVGIVALPLSIAFAIASGVKPEQGLITAVVAGFLISALSGSRFQIGGPTGAFIVIVYDIVQKYGYDGLAVATVMAGVLLIVMGLARMGDVIKFIPYPVTVGFTSGIALIIFTTQIHDFLGLRLMHTPEHFIDKWLIYLQHLAHVDGAAISLGVVTILLIIYLPRLTHHVPAALVAIILTTVAVNIFHLPVDTIGSRFGAVSNSFTPPRFPSINLDLLMKMSSPALTIALLAGIESLLSAVVADGMTGRRHRSNMELVAQGVANIVSPLWGGIPATGAIARTATNIKLGGATPVAGIIHAATVLFIFLFFAPFAAMIPMATLAGILIMVAYHMSEWKLFAKLLRSPKSDILVLLTTFLLTVLVDLTVAIEVGVVLAAFLFMRRMVAVTQVGFISASDEEEGGDAMATFRKNIPEGVEVFEINGPFFFGAADKFRDTMRELEEPPQVLILRMRFVPAMDATGLRALEDLIEKCEKDKVRVILSGLQAQPKKVLTVNGLLQRIGKDNICVDIDEALLRSKQVLKK